MATSPTSKSALLSGAAKDDAVGLDGDFTFTISDLLANDPGGAAKISTTTQFRFGTTEAEWANQTKYLSEHGITANLDGTYTINSDAVDFQYMVQIGNKGTWSQANVDIADRPDPVVVETPHNGDLKAEWTFENHTAGNGDEIGGAPTGFWDMSQWVATHPEFDFGQDAGTGFANNMQVHGVDGARALDTAASPGNIFLQAIPEGQGWNGESMPDLVAGQKYHAEVMVLKQDYSHVPEAVAAGHEGTNPGAWVEFRFNDQGLKVEADNMTTVNEFVKFDIEFTGVAGQDSFFIMSHGTNGDPQGLLIDQIQIHDWII